MAFKFRSKSSLPIIGSSDKQRVNEEISRHAESEAKMSNPQPRNRVYPSWLKDKTGPSHLPAIYQGVLGQVQLQPNINFASQMSGRSHLAATTKQQQIDYMNRFTDTERVHQLLSASQLSNDTLATIWAHVNQTFPGKLTNRELCLALSLIAVFQKLEENGHQTALTRQAKDPFQIVRSEKKPPVPKLYPNNSRNNSTQSNSTINVTKEKPEKLSTSLSMGAILVDLDDDVQSNCLNSNTNDDKSTNLKCNTNSESNLVSRDAMNIRYQTTNCLNLIDMITDDGLEFKLLRLAQVWSQTLVAIRGLFKRTFDILNVEHSRQGAIDALRSSHGARFSKQLCICYPLAHNIKCKIDQISGLKIIESFGQSKGQGEQILRQAFDRKYLDHSGDLMNAINEYWAVLINLFHESGQTKFIELIMDGLNDVKRVGQVNVTIEELANELDGLDKSSICSLCFYESYLSVNRDSLPPELKLDDLNLLIEEKHELLTDDKRFYYHAKCANFWLNHVDDQLPFQKTVDENILSPAIN